MKQLLPMLATASEPFDAPEYAFEIKWDGVRALAAVEASGWSLWGRDGVDYTARYPELAVLGRLPPGTLVDGELVVLRQGRADFAALRGRHQRRRPLPAGYQPTAVSFLLFDLLYERGRALLKETLRQRREQLRALLEKINEPPLVYSDAVDAAGRAFFAQAIAQGHEGAVAKEQAARYWPGKRCSSWRKIKPAELLPCVIIGYRGGRHDLQCLLVATVRQGVLRYVGQLTRGWSADCAAELAGKLGAVRRRSRPVVACLHRAWWVEPQLYCRVRCQGWTSQGRLRHGVYRGLLENPG
jgi:bifunctional non-homologous end joining protein LigD